MRVHVTDFTTEKRYCHVARHCVIPSRSLELTMRGILKLIYEVCLFVEWHEHRVDALVKARLHCGDRFVFTLHLANWHFGRWLRARRCCIALAALYWSSVSQVALASRDVL